MSKATITLSLRAPRTSTVNTTGYVFKGPHKSAADFAYRDNWRDFNTN